MGQFTIEKPALDLIYLVSCAVNEEEPSREKCAEMDLDALFEMSLRHSLTAAVAYALERILPPPEAFREEKYKVIRRLSEYEIECKRIFAEFDKRGIWHLPLKGIVINRYYPRLAMREMGDNDILCDSARMADVKAIMEGLGYECRRFAKDHHDVYQKSDVIDFEMHNSLFNPVKYPELYEYFKNIRSRLIREEGSDFCYRMTDEDFYLFLICHLHKHYSGSGTGLRSLLDVYMFNRGPGAGLDREYLNKELAGLGLLSFEENVSALAEKVFGGGLLTEKEQSALGFFVESNTLGTSKIRVMHLLGNEDSAKAKCKYIMKRIFLPRKEFERLYPNMSGRKIPYPFLVIYRPAVIILKRNKKSVKELKRIKSFKKNDNIEQF